MREWVKIIIATLVGATLTGVAWLLTEVREVQNVQSQNFVHVKKLQRLRSDVDDHESRIRELEEEICR